MSAESPCDFCTIWNSCSIKNPITAKGRKITNAHYWAMCAHYTCPEGLGEAADNLINKVHKQNLSIDGEEEIGYGFKTEGKKTGLGAKVKRFVTKKGLIYSQVEDNPPQLTARRLPGSKRKRDRK